VRFRRVGIRLITGGPRLKSWRAHDSKPFRARPSGCYSHHASPERTATGTADKPSLVFRAPRAHRRTGVGSPGRGMRVRAVGDCPHRPIPASSPTWRACPVGRPFPLARSIPSGPWDSGNFGGRAQAYSSRTVAAYASCALSGSQKGSPRWSSRSRHRLQCNRAACGPKRAPSRTSKRAGTRGHRRRRNVFDDRLGSAGGLQPAAGDEGLSLEPRVHEALDEPPLEQDEQHEER
jgi:hypothetical protein